MVWLTGAFSIIVAPHAAPASAPDATRAAASGVTLMAVFMAGFFLAIIRRFGGRPAPDGDWHRPLADGNLHGFLPAVLKAFSALLTEIPAIPNIVQPPLRAKENRQRVCCYSVAALALAGFGYLCAPFLRAIPPQFPPQA